MYQLSVRKRERKREETENQTGDDEQKNAWRFCSDTQGERVMKEKGKVLPKRVAGIQRTAKWIMRMDDETEDRNRRREQVIRLKTE